MIPDTENKNPEVVVPSQLCARQDMLGVIPRQTVMRKVAKKLSRHYTFDHSFHALREDERFWYLRTKPIRHETRTALEEYLVLTNMMQVMPVSL